MLLSGTQFSPSRIGATRTVCRPAVVIQRIISSGRSRRDFHGRVVIPRTFCSFAPPCPVLLFSTHFMPEKKYRCYRQHNSPVRDFGFLRFSLLLFCAHFTICRISAGLLSAAQFVKKDAFTPVYCCYTKHNSKNLFSGVVICGTFYEKLYFSIPCCYGQHSFSVCRVRLLSAAQFRSAGFLLPGLLNAAHFLQSSFSAPVL